MTDFDPAWPHGHRTRDGRKARIICTDASGSWPIIALIRDECGIEQTTRFEATGRGLLNAPPPAPPKIERWVTEGQAGEPNYSWYSREVAEQFARKALAGRPVRIVHLVESDE